MNLQCIQYFLEIATCGNFTKAAQRLYVSQPTLSRQISELEGELGEKLFDRQGRRVTLTAAGEIFQKEAIEIVTRCNNLPSQIKKRTSSVAGSVTIGFQNNMDSRLISSVIQSISEEYPEINIVLYQYEFGRQADCLKKNQTDLTITLASLLPPLPNLVSHKLRDNSLALALPAAHRLASSPGPISLKELEDEPFILLDRTISPVTVDCAINLCLNAGFSPHACSYCQDAMLIPLIVSAGKGVGFIFEQAINPYPELVKVVKIADAAPNFDIVLAYRKGASSLAVKTVIDEFLRLAPQIAAGADA